MDYIASGYVLAGFMLLFGGVFLYLAGQEYGGKGKGFLSVRVVSLLFAFLYFSIAFLNVWVATGNSLFLTNQAPCENVINTTVTDGTTTTYTYADSCANRSVPVTNERLYIILGYVMMLNFAAIIAGLLVLIIRGVMRW